MKPPRLLYILQKAYSTLQNGEWKRLHEPARSRNHYTMGSVFGSHGSDPVASAPYQLLLAIWVHSFSSFVAFTNWNWIQAIFELINGGKIMMSGDTLPEGESAIVISNHVGWTDFYMIQALAI